ncbi:MAG: ATP-binding protein [Solirubrobacteraceae bacterium]|jgi:signal transduction histidine kinase
MTGRELGRRLARRWRSLPPRTIRLRLTAVYGSLFIVCGAALLAITYGLVSIQYTRAFFENSGNREVAIQITVHSTGSAALFPVGTKSAHGVFANPQQGEAAIHHASGAVVSNGASGRITAPLLAAGYNPPSPKYLAALALGEAGAARGRLLLESGIALAIMALIAIGLGWVVAGRALRPLRQITAAAEEISASNLHRRLALRGPDDELRRLGNTFDGLLERLERAFVAQRQFAANVSHEPRTPLTYERALIEVALTDPDASAAKLREVCQSILSSGVHQERLIDALLVLSRSQRGLERHDPVDLAAVAGRALRDMPSREFDVAVSLGPAHTLGDARLLERLAANLVANAALHNKPGGSASISTRTSAGRAILAVRNSGHVIAADQVDRLFEPFERLDGARTSGDDRLGLGLSIVKAIADAHAATITTTALPEGGLSIEVSFPATSEHAADDSAGSPPTLPAN